MQFFITTSTACQIHCILTFLSEFSLSPQGYLLAAGSPEIIYMVFHHYCSEPTYVQCYCYLNVTQIVTVLGTMPNIISHYPIGDC